MLNVEVKDFFGSKFFILHSKSKYFCLDFISPFPFTPFPLEF